MDNRALQRQINSGRCWHDASGLCLEEFTSAIPCHDAQCVGSAGTKSELGTYYWEFGLIEFSGEAVLCKFTLFVMRT